MKRTAVKQIAALTAAILCIAGMRIQPAEKLPAGAVTIAELEAQKAENNKKIAEYQQQLEQFSADQKEEEAYQAALQDKIDVLQNNMQIIDTELEAIKENIFRLDGDITNMEMTISEQKVEIDQGLEEFKLRLRAMYVNGNDSLASALVGATDFYDLLSKYELISCVARHDDTLVNDLKEELEEYDRNLETLEAQRQQEEDAKAEQEVKQEEARNSMDELNAAYAESEAEKARLEQEQALANQSIDDLKKANEEADAAEAEIYEAIRKAEEEARRKAEEEAKKRAAEEEARRKAAEAAAAQQAQQNSSSGNTASAPTTSTPAVSTPTEDYSGSSFGWPCPGHYYISSGFAWRWGKQHKGIDIAQSNGADVVASRSGTVIKSYNGCTHNYGKSSNCCGNGYGNYVIIMHDDGTYSTLYGHMSSIIVSVGTYVNKGQTIGYVGSTGHSTGPHLHFEIRKNGTAVDPSGYLNY